MSVWMGRPGNRKIDNWECGGDATINEYFIRLTPDRQSKNRVLLKQNYLYKWRMGNDDQVPYQRTGWVFWFG